jgi:hypothetical protein
MSQRLARIDERYTRTRDREKESRPKRRKLRHGLSIDGMHFSVHGPKG